MRFLLLLAFAWLTASAAEDKPAIPQPIPELKLTNGTVFRNVTIVRYDADLVVLKSAAGTGPISYAMIPEPLRNTMLPVTGQSRKRQCDVVLRFRQAPREHFFIVEVQQRDSKPDINTFGGWVQKMNDVGAAGLICVSEAGFPQSIIEDVAKRQGPRVKLVTLDAGAANVKWADLHLVPQYIERSYAIIVEELMPPEFWDKKFVGLLKVTSDTRIVSSTGRPEDAQKLNDVLIGMMQKNDSYRPFPPEAIGKWTTMDLILKGSEEHPFWIHVPGEALRLRAWKMKVRVKRSDISKPIEFKRWNYTQEFHDSILAWVASATFIANGSPTLLSMVFVPDKDGFLKATFSTRRVP